MPFIVAIKTFKLPTVLGLKILILLLKCKSLYAKNL